MKREKMSSINPENLLFLVSQPRSGSSLLQQLLLVKKEVISMPEPWLMLPLVYIYKETDITAGYNPKYANINFKNYINAFNGSWDMVKSHVKDTALCLYNLNQLKQNQKYFLDKTPRYYHILPDLYDLFPGAKFILLARNPVSVFASMLDYNFEGNPGRLFDNDRLDDLLKAPAIIAGMKDSPACTDNMHFIRYEDLVNNPAAEMNRLSSYLAISKYSKEDLEYRLNQTFRMSNAIDKKSLSRHSVIVDEYLDSWKSVIDDRQKKSLLIEYISILGSDIFGKLGYDYQSTLMAVKKHKVKYRIPLKWEYYEKKGPNMRLYDHIYCGLVNRLNNYISNLAI